MSWNENQCNLVGNDFTNFLEISDWMKSYQSKEWEKLTPEKSTIATEHENLATKILGERGSKSRKFSSLKDLILKGKLNLM